MNIGLDGNEANVEKRVGSGEYTLELLKQFAANKKHHFVVFLKNKPLSHLPRESSNYQYKAFGPSKMWTQVALPIKLTLRSGIDVFCSLGHYGPRFSKVPYIMTIHDLSYLHYPELFKKNDLYQLKNWTNYSINKSAHILAVSQTTKNDIVRNYNVDSSKISVTYEGYDKNRFYIQPVKKIRNIINKFNIPGEYVVFVGTIQPRKNLEKLIDAFSFVKGDYSLVIAGKKGWQYSSIFKKVKELKMEKKIIFTDYVHDNDLPALICGAKAYILPSLWEGFGIPVIEAQACQVPVIISNTSSLPEIAGDSALGIDPTSISSISDALNKLLSDNNLQKELIIRGSKNVKRFSWNKCAHETIKVIEKVAMRS